MTYKSIDPIQVEQLLQIHAKGLVWAGDLISKDATKELRDLGLVVRSEGWYSCTGEGAKLARRYIIAVAGYEAMSPEDVAHG